jgi:hypothetical protein
MYPRLALSSRPSSLSLQSEHHSVLLVDLNLNEADKFDLLSNTMCMVVVKEQ